MNFVEFWIQQTTKKNKKIFELQKMKQNYISKPCCIPVKSPMWVEKANLFNYSEKGQFCQNSINRRQGQNVFFCNVIYTNMNRVENILCNSSNDQLIETDQRNKFQKSFFAQWSIGTRLDFVSFNSSFRFSLERKKSIDLRNLQLIDLNVNSIILSRKCEIS